LSNQVVVAQLSSVNPFWLANVDNLINLNNNSSTQELRQRWNAVLTFTHSF